MKPPFERTVCACDECVAFCKRQPGYLIPGDAERISEFLGEPAEKYLWASKGALVKDSTTGQAFWIRTITPQMKRGRCVFLDENDQCKIHEVSPFGCSHFDAHQSKAEGDRRSSWGLRQILESAAYKLLRDKLPLAASWKPRK